MYICICKGITDKDIREAIKSRRNSTAKDVMKSLGVGSDCGSCVEDAVENVLRELKNQKPAQHKDKIKTN